MRVLLCGTSEFAVPTLQRLVMSGQYELLCVTQPDRPQGRGRLKRPSPVKVEALARQVPVEEPEELGASLARFRAFQPDVGLAIAYGRLLPAQMLGLPPRGCFGLHPSLLPKYRGASPIAWALLNGERTTGVTVFRLTERMDAGEIALQQSMAIESSDTTERLSERLADTGATLVLEALEQLQRQTLRVQPQREADASYAPKLTKADGRIEWDAPAAAIERLVRAMTPWPTAYTSWRQQQLTIWSARVESRPDQAAQRPGQIIAVSAEGIVVAAGEGALAIRELQVAGRRRMRVQEFLAGHDLRAGEVLGVAKWPSG